MPTARERRHVLRMLLDALRRILRGKPAPPPVDPYACITVPLRRGPKGRSGAAVAEVEDDSFENFPPRR